MVWYNNSWLGFLKILNYVPKEKEKYTAKKSPHLSQLNVAMAHRNYFMQNNLWILKLATYIQRLKITIQGANWQLFRSERIAKYVHILFCLRPCVLNSPPKKGGDVTLFHVSFHSFCDISAKQKGIVVYYGSFESYICNLVL